MRLRIGGNAVLTLLAAVGISLLVPETAGATVSGGCSATLNGTDLKSLPFNPDSAVVVGKNDVVPMTMTSPSGQRFDKLQIELDIVGHDWVIYKAPAGGGTWSHNIDVNSFARWGVGLYQLKGVGYYPGGSFCDGFVYVNVTGDPFSTAAGISAAAASGLGVLSVFGAGIAAGGEGGGDGGGPTPYTPEDAERDAANQEEKKKESQAYGETLAEISWGKCWLFALAALPLFLLLGAGAMLMAVVAPARVRWTPRISAVGLVGGVLTGLGAGTLLQEYAVIYPTRTWGIVYVVGGILFGLAVPQIGRLIAVRRFNRRHA